MGERSGASPEGPVSQFQRAGGALLLHPLALPGRLPSTAAPLRFEITGFSPGRAVIERHDLHALPQLWAASIGFTNSVHPYCRLAIMIIPAIPAANCNQRLALARAPTPAPTDGSPCQLLCPPRAVRVIERALWTSPANTVRRPGLYVSDGASSSGGDLTTGGHESHCRPRRFLEPIRQTRRLSVLSIIFQIP